jgi:hypothetical protein
VTLAFTEPVLKWIPNQENIVAVYRELDNLFVREDLSRLHLVKIIARGVELRKPDIQNTLVQINSKGILEIEIR